MHLIFNTFILTDKNCSSWKTNKITVENAIKKHVTSSKLTLSVSAKMDKIRKALNNR
jgi:hypothetical protein